MPAGCPYFLLCQGLGMGLHNLVVVMIASSKPLCSLISGEQKTPWRHFSAQLRPVKKSACLSTELAPEAAR